MNLVQLYRRNRNVEKADDYDVDANHIVEV